MMDSESQPVAGTSHVDILMPVFNDWPAAFSLLFRLEEVLARRSRRARILLVDDGSTTPMPEGALGSLSALEEVRVLRLRRNCGHQRAIAAGLSYLEAHGGSEAVVVMDADGQDDPADVPRLLERFAANGGERIILAERTSRSEGPIFRAFYRIYQGLHLVLVGTAARTGNFSVLGGQAVRRLTVMSETWNHYGAAIAKSRLPCELLPAPRAPRTAGEPKMNFTALVLHGLAAIAVQAETATARLLLGTLGAAAVLLVLWLAASVFRLFGLVSAGWAWTFEVLLLIAIQAAIVWTAAILLLLRGRSAAETIPSRDFAILVEGCRRIHPPER